MRPELAAREVETPELATARAAASAFGVTRLADITGLDRIGVPVFQAIRPLSRALVVHQGKGRTRSAAQTGALMESVESASAEAFDRRSGVSAWRDLPGGARPRCLADFAWERDNPPGADDPMAWTPATRLLDGAGVVVPFDTVSLDYTRPWDRRLDHTSNGLASRFDPDGAVLKGLLEVLERDATWAWRLLPLGFRAARAIEIGSITDPWFQEIAQRLREAGVRLSLYWLPALIRLPVVYAELFEPAAGPAPRAVAGGCACAPRAREALEGALLEALQVRLTAIAGARDDILHDSGGDPVHRREAVLLPPGLQGLRWESLLERGDGQVTSWRIAEALAAAGYPDASVVPLVASDARVSVVKVFIPGLAANLRARRPPLAGDP